MVPDRRRRTEPNRPASLLNPPAYVDVISGDAKLRIEAVQLLETFFAKGHVAPRDVFGNVIRERTCAGRRGPRQCSALLIDQLGAEG